MSQYPTTVMSPAGFYQHGPAGYTHFSCAPDANTRPAYKAACYSQQYSATALPSHLAMSSPSHDQRRSATPHANYPQAAGFPTQPGPCSSSSEDRPSKRVRAVPTNPAAQHPGYAQAQPSRESAAAAAAAAEAYRRRAAAPQPIFRPGTASSSSTSSGASLSAYASSHGGSSTRGPSTSPMPQQYHSAAPARPSGYMQRESTPRFEHGPTELPPRGYSQSDSPFRPKKPVGKIPGSAMDYLPVLEARFDRLENAIDQYVDLRAKKALENSILPGSQQKK